MRWERAGHSPKEMLVNQRKAEDVGSPGVGQCTIAMQRSQDLILGQIQIIKEISEEGDTTLLKDQCGHERKRSVLKMNGWRQEDEFGGKIDSLRILAKPVGIKMNETGN